MAFMNVIGFETGDARETAAVGGTQSFQTTFTAGAWSAYALRTNPVGANAGYVRLGTLAATGATTDFTRYDPLYSRFLFSPRTLPASGDEPIYLLDGTSPNSAPDLEVRINSDGKLKVYDCYNGGAYGTPTLKATGTTALALNTYYRIEIKADASSGVNCVWEVKIDGVSEMSGSFADDTAWVSAYFGKSINRNGNDVDFIFDDICLKNDAFPGAGRVSLLKPNANGNYQTWTIGAGSGSHYENVDDVPHDSDTTYLLSTLVVDQAETEALQPASTHSISGTINCVKPFGVLKRDGASNGAVRLRTRSGSTDSDTSSNFVPAAAYALTARLLTTDPADAAAWTTADLDALEVGAVEKSAANRSRLTFCGAMVDWTPAAGGTDAVPQAWAQYRRRHAG